MLTPDKFLPKLRDHVEKLLGAYSTGPFSKVFDAKDELQVFLSTVVPGELPVLGEEARGKAETIANKVHLVPGVGMRRPTYSFEINRCRSVLIDIEKALTHLTPSTSEPPETPAVRVHVDGWGDVSFGHLRPQLLLLLNVLRLDEWVGTPDLLKTVWKNVHVSDRSIKAAISKLNVALRKNGVGLSAEYDRQRGARLVAKAENPR